MLTAVSTSDVSEVSTSEDFSCVNTSSVSPSLDFSDNNIKIFSKSENKFGSLVVIFSITESKFTSKVADNNFSTINSWSSVSVCSKLTDDAVSDKFTTSNN